MDRIDRSRDRMIQTVCWDTTNGGVHLKERYAVAIDGPAGAGKSSLAKAAARELGILYVDTGAIYRTVACYMLDHGAEEPAAVETLLPQVQIGLRHGEDGLQRMALNGEDVTERIRLPEVSMAASRVSAIPAVRQFLLEMQRRLAREQSVIMDGRDIGTVVLPAADVKIFLTASPEERARRRWRELEERGTPQPYEAVLAEVERRDKSDRERPIAPLRPAEDAILLDTTALDYAQSLQRLLEIVRGGL